MRKPWPFALAVIIIGGMAGVAIAGRPVQIDPFVLQPATTAAGSTSTAAEPPTTSTSAPAIATTIETSSTEPAATSVAPIVLATEPTPTIGAATTTAAPATTAPGPLPRDQVRLVIANGDGRFRLASITADRVRPLGYVIVLGIASNRVDATVIYYRPDFDDEAAFAAIDIGVPDAIILAFPITASQPVTDADANGDVVIVLGPDAPR